MVSKEGRRQVIIYHTISVGCDFLSLPLIHAFDAALLICYTTIPWCEFSNSKQYEAVTILHNGFRR